MGQPTVDDGSLAKVINSLKSIQQTQSDLVAAVDLLNQRYQQLLVDPDAAALGPNPSLSEITERSRTPEPSDAVGDSAKSSSSDLTLQAPAVPSSPSQRSGLTSRIILTYVFSYCGAPPASHHHGRSLSD